METRLVDPDLAYQDTYLAALREAHAEGRHLDLDPDALAADFAGFIAALRARTDPARLPPGMVPETVLWLVDDGPGGGTFLGRLSIRHELTDDLRLEGGNIGYEIRPSARRRGHGTRILALGLERARALGLREVLVTCDADNGASRRIIERNGGVYQDSVELPGEPVPKLRFWIALPSEGGARTPSS